MLPVPGDVGPIGIHNGFICSGLQVFNYYLELIPVVIGAAIFGRQWRGQIYGG